MFKKLKSYLENRAEEKRFEAWSVGTGWALYLSYLDYYYQENRFAYIFDDNYVFIRADLERAEIAFCNMARNTGQESLWKEYKKGNIAVKERWAPYYMYDAEKAIRKAAEKFGGDFYASMGGEYGFKTSNNYMCADISRWARNGRAHKLNVEVYFKLSDVESHDALSTYLEIDDDSGVHIIPLAFTRNGYYNEEEWIHSIETEYDKYENKNIDEEFEKVLQEEFSSLSERMED